MINILNLNLLKYTKCVKVSSPWTVQCLDVHNVLRCGSWAVLLPVVQILKHVHVMDTTPCEAGAPLFPLVHLLPHLFPLFTFSFIGFTYFLLLFITSLSTRIVPLRFQAGGCWRRPKLGLVCFCCVICVICIP